MSDALGPVREIRGCTLAVLCAEVEEVRAVAGWELAPVVCGAGCRVVHTASNQPIVVNVSGPGLVAAAASAAHLVDVHGAGVVLSLGFFGRVGGAEPGTVPVLVQRTGNYGCVTRRGATTADLDRVRPLKPDPDLMAATFRLAEKAGIPLAEGVILSADVPLHDRALGDLLARHLDALGVDMETAAVAQVCDTRGVAWLSIRVASDRADERAAHDHAVARARGIPPGPGALIAWLADWLGSAPAGVESPPGGASKHELQVLAVDRDLVFHPFTSPDVMDDELPRVIVRAHGVRVWDARGRCYLDGVAGTKNVCLGHGHPAVLPVLTAQAAELSHWPADGFTFPALVHFAGALARLLPRTLRHVFTNSGGSEAIETALRMAREYHRARGEGHRYRVLSLLGSYHGATVGALSVSAHPGSREGAGPLLEGGVVVAPPASSDAEAVERALQQAERVVEAMDPRSFSCILFEPTQGLGGVHPLPPAYMAGLVDLARSVGALTVVDEVACGLGRTGEWFDFVRSSRVPDILACGKALSNGTVPLSATVATDEVHSVITAGALSLRHGHTSSGHPLAAAVGARVIESLVHLDVLAPVRARAVEFERNFLPRLRALPWVAEVRHAGLWVGVELVVRSGDGPRVAGLSRALYQSGLMHEMLGSTIAISPALVTSADDWQAMCSALTRGVEEMR